MLRKIIFEELGKRLYFSVYDLAEILGITRESAMVLATRYTKSGLFIRVKKDFYILSSNWLRYNDDDFMKIANLIQVPSYISFMTALNIYGITTQVLRGYYESVALKRTLNLKVNDVIFNYYKIKKDYYFDFIRKGEIFIGTKEKAFLDAVYLFSFGKYRLDFDAIDIRKLDIKKLKRLLANYPEKTVKIIKHKCKI